MSIQSSLGQMDKNERKVYAVLTSVTDREQHGKSFWRSPRQGSALLYALWVVILRGRRRIEVEVRYRAAHR